MKKLTLILISTMLLSSMPALAQEKQESFTVTNYFSERYRDFQGTKISIVPPDGYFKDTLDIGFVNIKNGSALRTEERREDVSFVASSFFKNFDTLSHKDSLGAELHESFNFRINGFQSHLVHLSTIVDGEDYLEWILFIGDKSYTYIVKGFIPRSKQVELELPVRTALLSVFYEPDRRIIPAGVDATTTSSSSCSCHSKK